jgi:hypothetical protein
MGSNKCSRPFQSGVKGLALLVEKARIGVKER